jgi:hypothetical protein
MCIEAHIYVSYEIIYICCLDLFSLYCVFFDLLILRRRLHWKKNIKIHFKEVVWCGLCSTSCGQGQMEDYFEDLNENSVSIKKLVISRLAE